MNLVFKIPSGCIAATIVFLAGHVIAADAPEKQAHITQIIKDVQLLPSGAAAQQAALNDTVNENTGVKTGEASRSELTFTDLTITRLGANTIFSFDKAGREVQLDSGAILFRVPKNSGGGSIKTHAVTVGITGTTVIFESSNSGHDALTVLEGDAELALVDHPDQSKHVRAGQMLDVKAGASKLSSPVEVDLSEIMKKSPLIKGFPPLPSQDLIIAAINDQQASSSKESSVPRTKTSSGKSSSKSPVYHGRPVSDEDDEPSNPVVIPSGSGRWVNPYGDLNPGSHGGRGKGGNNTSGSSSYPDGASSDSTPRPRGGRGKGNNNASSNSNTSNSTPTPGKGTSVFKGSGRVIKGKTSGTPTPTPNKLYKNVPP